MSVVQFWRFTCPITSVTTDTNSVDLPTNWFYLNNVAYAQEAQAVMAARIGRGITDPVQIVALLGTVTGDV